MARYMSSTELFQKMEEDQDIVVIGVLPEDKFKEEHIPGAINIPLDQLPDRVRDFRKNQRIVVYGETHTDEASNKAAALLETLGFRKVADFDGGVHAWKQAGYLTVTN
ncbi:rhodanese-like domain-containing protein [Microvenator marinus]|uniref:Rhodanese-like domain-containing protein n=1 Tax=Microvenator marinus TaxID=2600177 RepID=A0A5B8XPN4_9DELT|nr:rhodanese-like domain-containing protein [Microvenator marinus]QED25706.1 rhodanese-like domain-containing protein [Microvenator marinus]